MNVARITALFCTALLTTSCCRVLSPIQGVPKNPSSPIKFSLLSGDLAVEPAYVRVVLVDKTKKPNYTTQALPASWESAVVRLHATDVTAKLTQDRVALINKTGGFAGNTTNTAVFNTLRPGGYIFQVNLFTLADGGGTSAAVHTINLNLAGGSATAITVTMKTTDGTGGSGGTTLNAAISDTTGFIRSNGANYNSVLGGPAAAVIVAGDTLILDPQLADSTANGNAAVTSGTSTTSAVAALDPGVLSRVLLTYVKGSVTPTGMNLDASETILTDWVRTGNEPIRGTAWTTLADGTDGDTWPARGAATRTGAGTFAGTFNWNTDGTTFSDPLPFSDESGLAENYRLVYRYYDNTYSHKLIKIRTLPLAVVASASITLTLQ
ncbi:MAG TPA: hypothetical protein DD435_02535 [Cyanobacteria bacterium UBA8530]|nr:hypothetical protein [Cyanobacteria bacterium UBA8530]